MKLPVLRTGALAAGVLAGALCLYAQSSPAKDEHPAEGQRLGPRATPGDYPVHVKGGAVIIAAEFAGHYVPTPEGTYSTEDYVAVDTGVFGAPGTHVTLSAADFSLRVNGKKPLPAQSAIVVATNAKDPQWEADQPVPEKSKTAVNAGGQQQDDTGTRPPPKMPPALVHAMTQHVLKTALPEGDRTLPQGGLLFFEYRGRDKSIHSVELIYKGPAGEATLTLHP